MQNNFQILFRQFNRIYADYRRDKAAYNLEIIRPLPFIPDKQFNNVPGDIPVNDINNILTSAITNEFLTNTNTILDIINLYHTMYNYAIVEYIRTHAHIGVNNTNIKFVFKGGLSMLLVVSKLIYEMPEIIANEFINRFVNNIFAKSDIDFGIVIDYRTIGAANRATVFNDMYNISFMILSLVRNYIVKYKYEFSDFEKNNLNYQMLILQKIRSNINTGLATNGIGINDDTICKIGTGQIYEEEPCPNNVEIIDDIAYDEIYIHDPADFNQVTINCPQQIGLLQLKEEHKYILSANIVQFNNALGNLVKFGLTRMKVFFSLYRIKDAGIGGVPDLTCCDYTKGKGEIIDVSITHHQDGGQINVNDYLQYNINQYIFNMPTLDYLFYDHYNMLHNTKPLPWLLPKFQKRLKRFNAFAILLFSIGINNRIIVNLTQFFNAYLGHLRQHNNDPIYANNPILQLANRFNYAGLPAAAIEQYYINLINNTTNNINVANHVDEKDNLNIFINELTIGINNIITILGSMNNYLRNPTITTNNSLNLNNRINMFGGFNPCDTNPNRMLGVIINNLSLYNSINIRLNMNGHEKFYQCYNYLIREILDHRQVNQIFTDNDTVEIYNSTRDQSVNMQNINNPVDRKILRNYNKNITAFMFLNFLVDYHSFLITYDGLTYYTDKIIRGLPPNPYMLLNWNNPRPSDIYKNEIIDKSPEDLLKEFCNDINNRYYRFIKLLLLILKNKLEKLLPRNLTPNDIRTKLTIDDITEQLFAINHRSINKYEPNSVYDYMFHHWKNRLANYLNGRFTGLNPINLPIGLPANINLGNIERYFFVKINECILTTINKISNQNGRNTINETYLADSDGLFSNLFLLNNLLPTNNKKKYFGSCIPSSINEMYLLLRIYEDGTNVGFGLERQNMAAHNIWSISEPETATNLSHWTCIWNREIYTPAGGFANQINTFRTFPTYPQRQNNMLTVLANPANNADPANNATITASKKKLINAFCYLPIDYRIEFIRQNRFAAPGVVKANILRNQVAVQLRQFIAAGTI
jgi:hypothetical protein